MSKLTMLTECKGCGVVVLGCLLCGGELVFVRWLVVQRICGVGEMASLYRSV